MRLVKFILFFAVTCFIGQYLTRIQGPTMLYWFVTYPGTFFHESMHYLVALFSGGEPTMHMWPEWDAQGHMTTMGHVNFYPGLYNAASTGLAPFLLVPLLLLFLTRAACTKSLLTPFLWAYFAACAWAACVPSPPDFAIATSQPLSYPFAAMLFGITGYVSYRVVRFSLRV